MKVEVVLQGSELGKGDIVFIPNTNTMEGIFVKSDDKWAYFYIVGGTEGNPIQYYDLRYNYYVVDPISYIKNKL